MMFSSTFRILSKILLFGLWIYFSFSFSQESNCYADTLDLSNAVIVVHEGERPAAEKMAAKVLIEEVQKRSRIRWSAVTKWPTNKPVVAISAGEAKEICGQPVPFRDGKDFPEKKPEGYRIVVQNNSLSPVVWIIGADPRGALFGAGKLLRTLTVSDNFIGLSADLKIAVAPFYPIRGHQLGYRNTANSYDAWSLKRYEQYIRELAIFGVNCIENIPSQDQRNSIHMKVSRDEMNRKLSEICARYDMDYWIWTPAVFNLTDKEKRKAEIEKHEKCYRECARLNAVFFPGGDPGDNHPKDVMPFLKDLSARLEKYHPEAGIWISLQGFDQEETNYFFDYVKEKQPEWLEGVVYGPSSPSIDTTRKRLPARYRLRHYPDITHTVRCQYPVEWWDQAFALTLGREPCNPQPYYYAKIHNKFAPFTNGFLAYSDGVHDDVNKTVWSMRGWDPEMDVRDILVEYCRFFFGAEIAESAADGILALERNWVGGLVENGSVEATLSFWNSLARESPRLSENWRWQLLLLRAAYDAYTRRRLLYEQKLEKEANEILLKASSLGIEQAMNDALKIVNKAVTEPICKELRQQIEELCDSLFKTIGLQTSVNRYGASGAERGCILDFVDYPLNNRWWLEDEFTKIREMSMEQEKLARLEIIRSWENPGPGSYYDNIGNIAQAPHLDFSTEVAPDYAWWDNGFSRLRLSSQVYMDWPELRYENLDPNGNYLIRVAGYGEALLKVDGKRIKPRLYNKGAEQFKEFSVPQDLLKDGQIKITWDKADEVHLNWRYRSRISDVWLLKR